MTEVRRAGAEDAGELVRLRALMLGELFESSDERWKPIAVAALRSRLVDPAETLASFVVDRPGSGGLAACVIGAIETRLGSPNNPSGRGGYVFSVATDPDSRRRGYARACMEALLDWFRAHGITKVDLRATDQGAPLYESLGFTRSTEHMRLKL